jgi:soluble lytic murein transglycosylase
LTGVGIILLLAALVGGAPIDAAALEPYFGAGRFKGAAEKFRAGDWAGAAEGLEAALRAGDGGRRGSEGKGGGRPGDGGRGEAPVGNVRGAGVEELRARYLWGTALANLSRWKAAAGVFDDLWAEDRVLGSYVAYQSARCHLRAGEEEAALVWVAKVTPGSIPEAEAALVAIDALTSLQRWGDLEQAAARFAEKFPAGPRRHEALFARGAALEGLKRPAEAVAIYRRVWSEAGVESWSKRSGARLDALAPALTAAEKAFALKTAADWVARGMVLFDRHANEAAEAAFVASLAAPGGQATLACQARFHLAQSVFKARQRGRAAPLFAEAETACRAAGNDELIAQALYQRGRCLAASGDGEGASATFARLEAAYPASRLADDARLRTAEVADGKGDAGAAAEILAALPERYPAGDMVGESLWRRAFAEIRRGQFQAASPLLAENIRRVPHATIWYAEGRAEYWQGRTFEEQKDLGAAATWYERGIREYPLSVYSLQGMERLDRIAPPKRAALLRELRAPVAAVPAPGTLAPQAFYRDDGFTRALELARLGLVSDAHRELARVAATVTEPVALEDLYWVTALILDRGGYWNASHALVSDKLARFRREYPRGAAAARWQVAYPRAWSGLVEANSRANGVPVALQLAIMREESAFNPRAESTANCLGLCMLKRATAQQVLGGNVTHDALWSPTTNIAAGSKYLAALIRRYNGAIVPAIAAYNAGEGAVDKWLAERREVATDEFLETIPYDETRNYTKRVLASYFAYGWLYDRDLPRLPPRLSARGR